MAIGSQLAQFYSNTSEHQRQRLAQIIDSPDHWGAIEGAAFSQDDKATRRALRNLRKLFDERKAADPFGAGGALFRLMGILGSRSSEFMEMLEAAG